MSDPNKMNSPKGYKIVHKDILAMNISWSPEDLELYENHSNLFASCIFTTARVITLIMAIIVQRAFYKLMKRLPGRAINELLYPNMVRYVHLISISFSGKNGGKHRIQQTISCQVLVYVIESNRKNMELFYIYEAVLKTDGN